LAELFGRIQWTLGCKCRLSYLGHIPTQHPTMQKPTLLLFAQLVFLISCSTEKADPLVVSIDSVMTAVVDTARFNGNILLARNGKVIYQKSFGWANFDTKESLNDSSLFELASVSKQFTAMGIMMLREQGKISYEDDVRKYLPELPYEGMTIRHFLTHTSGIPDYMDLGIATGWDRKRIVFNDDIIEMLARHKPAVLFQPGEKWEYSNTAYALLASIIGRVSGKPYGTFLAENIFTPVGMTRTRTYNTRRSKGEVLPNYAFGFVYSDSLSRFVLPDSLPGYWFVYTLDGVEGDGIVNSTTGDLFRWNEALYSDKLVKTETLQEAYTPVMLNDGTTYPYGFGWGTRVDSTAGKIVAHSGGWPGYSTSIIRYLDRRDCLIILTNNDGYGMRPMIEGIQKRLKTI
jgi:CubicO group peptidase (beta-lactamase class C family)